QLDSCFGVEELYRSGGYVEQRSLDHSPGMIPATPSKARPVFTVAARPRPVREHVGAGPPRPRQPGMVLQVLRRVIRSSSGLLPILARSRDWAAFGKPLRPDGKPRMRGRQSM